MYLCFRILLNVWRKSLTATTQEWCGQYWTGVGSSIPQGSCCTATYHPSKLTIKIRRTRNVGHCWRSRDELISDVLLWTPSHGRVKSGRPARTNIQQLCADTACTPEDLPETMDDREGWREMVRDIRADSAMWWWWWWWLMLNWIGWYRTVYLYKMDLALNNLQRLIYPKT